MEDKSIDERFKYMVTAHDLWERRKFEAERQLMFDKLYNLLYSKNFYDKTKKITNVIPEVKDEPDRI